MLNPKREINIALEREVMLKLLAGEIERFEIQTVEYRVTVTVAVTTPTEEIYEEG